MLPRHGREREIEEEMGLTRTVSNSRACSLLSFDSRRLRLGSGSEQSEGAKEGSGGELANSRRGERR